MDKRAIKVINLKKILTSDELCSLLTKVLVKTHKNTHKIKNLCHTCILEKLWAAEGKSGFPG